MYCPQCGSLIIEEGKFCYKCGSPVSDVQEDIPEQKYQEGYSSDEPVISRVIPYKNSSAIIAYYLGVFACIPCLGIFLGIAAVVFGIKGLNHYREYPRDRGKTHAWVGIIAGGIFALGYLAGLVFVIVASSSA
jgi:hypothetical protein